MNRRSRASIDRFAPNPARAAARVRVGALGCTLALALAFAFGCGRRDDGRDARSAKDDTRVDASTGEELFVAAGIVPGQRGGSIVVGAATGPQTFNPLVATDAASSEVIHRIFDGLVELDCASGEYYPALASRWDVSADGTRWTFHLRRGVRWADGAPFTADDVLWNFEVVYDESLGAVSRETFMLDGKPFALSKGASGSAETITIETPRPFGALLSALATELPLLPKHVWDTAYREGRIAEAAGIDAPPAQLFGTGPFRLAISEPGRVVLERNANYWKTDTRGTRLPFADRLTFVNAGDWNTWRLKFDAGEVDHYIPRPDEIAALRESAADSAFVLFDLGARSGTTHLWFNQNPGRDANGEPFVSPARLAWFRDLRFRQAVAHAIDREAIVRTCFNGFGTIIDGPVSPSNRLWHNARLPRYEFDRAKAQALLREIGFADRDGDGVLEDAAGTRAAFSLVTNSESPVRVAIGRLIEEDLRAVGIDARLEAVEIGTLVARVQETFRYDACLLALSGGEEPSAGLAVWLSSGEMHQFHPSQPSPATAWERECDSLLTACVETVVLSERKRLFDRVQELYALNLGWIFLANENTFLAVRNRFGNVRPGTLRSMNEFCWNEDELFVR